MAALVTLVLPLPVAAGGGSDGGGGVRGSGGGGGDEARVRVGCLGGTAELRLRAADKDGDEDEEGDEDSGGGTIEIELRVDVPRSVSTWRVVVLHERRLVLQGRRRASGGGHSLRLRHVVPDWPSSETISARLTALDGRTCRLAATI